MSLFRLCAGWALLALALANDRAHAASTSAGSVSYNTDIRPILSDNCFSCHGPDPSKRKAKLRLDVRTDAISKGAIVPGDPGQSELIVRIMSEDEDDRMPPPSSHKTLTPEQQDLLKRWIAEGAEYQGHWAYTPPVKTPVPEGTHPIDSLVRTRLAQLGLQPSPEASRRVLARRLFFDLVGPPPSPEEVDAFERDTAPDAWERLVEKLLNSPQYGERMAIGWLDVVRYADTIGYHSDNPRNVWPYRDYVIRAFNENKPFDQFTREQLAGDLLPGSSLEQKVGSAFNRLLLSTEEGGAQPKDYEARMLTDRVRAVGAVWLGQTIGCAQCHDHKFDPITARDFYSMGAFFADIKEPIIGRREDGILVPNAEQAAELARLKAALAAAREDLERPFNARMAEYDQSIALELDGLRAQVAAAMAAKTNFEATVPHCLVSESLEKPRTVRILPRGDWMNESGEVVRPALPAFLAGPAGPGTDGKPLTRLDLANWIVSRENPLTARVVINRIWKQFFGMGLSKVLDDFGAQGETPPNLALLDWLACEFMDSGWDIKHMVRLMVTSQTYKQTSLASKELRERDPDNRTLARQGRWRLEAELVRDNALAVAGLLDPRIGGPSVKPYQPDGYWENLNFPVRSYEASLGADQYRRGLYTWWQRSYPHPSLLAFDAPTREECAADRSRSNIPQQALVLLNDPSYVEAARVFAARILDEGGSETSARLDWAWRQVLSRLPSRDEAQACADLLAQELAEYTRNSQAAASLLKVGAEGVPSNLNPAELAAWTSIARVLLNLHETITRS